MPCPERSDGARRGFRAAPRGAEAPQSRHAPLGRRRDRVPDDAGGRLPRPPRPGRPGRSSAGSTRGPPASSCSPPSPACWRSRRIVGSGSPGRPWARRRWSGIVVIVVVTVGTGLPGPSLAVVAVGAAVLALVGIVGGFVDGPPQRGATRRRRGHRGRRRAARRRGLRGGGAARRGGPGPGVERRRLPHVPGRRADASHRGRLDVDRPRRGARRAGRRVGRGRRGRLRRHRPRRPDRRPALGLPPRRRRAAGDAGDPRPPHRRPRARLHGLRRRRGRPRHRPRRRDRRPPRRVRLRRPRAGAVRHRPRRRDPALDPRRGRPAHGVHGPRPADRGGAVAVALPGGLPAVRAVRDEHPHDDAASRPGAQGG